MLNIPLKDYLRETRLFNTRLAFAGAVMLILTLLLLARTVYLQVINHRHYATLSQANRVKPLPIPPPRGLILDRNGVILAQNYPVYTLEIIPEQVDDMDELLADLGELVRVTEGDLKAFRKQLRERPRFENLTLRTHLNDEEAGRIAVRLPFFNGVELQARLQRHYPLGSVAVHALGYVSRISEADLERIDRSAYRGMRHIGKLGVESTYEQSLLGRVGLEKVETNAHGRALRTLERVAPAAGRNLHLNLDARLQVVAEQALAGKRGAVVAIEPSTGGVLAFASTPTYDPNAFVNGIDTASYKALLENPDKPLINRALNGQYAPGSTIKVFFGLMALEAGQAFNAHEPVFCPGHFNLPGSSHLFRDWKKAGHGVVTLRDAIAQSCDVYFYKLATAVGPDRMKSFLAPFGFGKATGIDLPSESSGLVPSPEWKKSRGQPWYPGETVITGIGQGSLLATPLQLATATATIATRGERMRPVLMRAYEDAKTRERIDFIPEVSSRVLLRDKRHWDELKSHMTAVAHTNRGTAYGIGHNAPYQIAGKTGTAQVRGIAQGARYDEHGTPERLRDHALFVSFAPADHPRVAVAVIVENGGHGSSAAAPIARKVMDHVILGHAISTPVKPATEDDE
ncbi:penicillin-binding protein 2 [Sulfurifustis variabilis]|uniref:Peptidoglycan D,D-transpeptidase MrdA n=1 Tax=Sulfurifustis variabilis TaxID=1675686 RepID=A0A1B4VA91_9GAMM|nr:penicillin-binding protein 2 [Sulfurifustis variabilis]BAU46761.1 penicillin-binding protein 2 [Sulfurifustis variabilis]